MKAWVLALIDLLSASACGAAETYSASAPSSISVETTPQGWILHQRSVRFEAYQAIPDDIKVGVPFASRLATITAKADGALDDQTRAIDVTVDAMEDGRLRRIATFSDPGEAGAAVGGLYFITAETTCCGRPTRHVRNVETGAWLFDASGGWEAGMAAWIDVPNHHPTIERWAAFAGAPDGDAGDLLGLLRYGDRTGAIMTVELRMDPARQLADFAIDLPTCGALVWREPGKMPGPGQARRPAAGTCSDGGSYSPTSLFSLEHMTGPLGGFELEVSVFGKVYATIPVKDDRLDVSQARVEAGLRLVVRL